MNLLNKITKLASESLEREDYTLHALLSRVATDLAFVETNRHFIKQFKKAQTEISQMKKDLSGAHMYKLSEELDVIARDIENKILLFSREDPIESVLNSYKLVHKIARVEEPQVIMKEILDIAETMPEPEFIRELQKRTMGMTLNDKKNLLYVLDKDMAIEIPLEKIATSIDVEHDEFIRNPKTKEDHEHNKKALKKILKEYRSLPDEERENFKLPASFPSEPYIWSGFAFETSVPYQQSSQLNFWSLASQDIKNRVATLAQSEFVNHPLVKRASTDLETILSNNDFYLVKGFVSVVEDLVSFLRDRYNYNSKDLAQLLERFEQFQNSSDELADIVAEYNNSCKSRYERFLSLLQEFEASPPQKIEDFKKFYNKLTSGGEYAREFARFLHPKYKEFLVRNPEEQAIAFTDPNKQFREMSEKLVKSRIYLKNIVKSSTMPSKEEYEKILSRIAKRPE